MIKSSISALSSFNFEGKKGKKCAEKDIPVLQIWVCTVQFIFKNGPIQFFFASSLIPL